jgi:hypothetical protein
MCNSYRHGRDLYCITSCGRDGEGVSARKRRHGRRFMAKRHNRAAPCCGRARNNFFSNARDI